MAQADVYYTRGIPAVTKIVEIQPEVKPEIDFVSLSLTADEAKFVYAVVGVVSQSGVFQNLADEKGVESTYDYVDGVSVYVALGDKLYGIDCTENPDRAAWGHAARKWVINHYRTSPRIV